MCRRENSLSSILNFRIELTLNFLNFSWGLFLNRQTFLLCILQSNSFEPLVLNFLLFFFFEWRCNYFAGCFEQSFIIRLFFSPPRHLLLSPTKRNTKANFFSLFIFANPSPRQPLISLSKTDVPLTARKFSLFSNNVVDCASWLAR